MGAYDERGQSEVIVAKTSFVTVESNAEDDTHLEGTSKSWMGPLMKEASSRDDSLMSEASLEMVNFCISSSSTLMLWAFSLADILAVVVGDKGLWVKIR